MATTASTPSPEAQTFKGNGVENIGTVTVDVPSTLHWSCPECSIFSVLAKSEGASVIALDSQKNTAGDTAAEPGTYHSVSVQAYGEGGAAANGRSRSHQDSRRPAGDCFARPCSGRSQSTRPDRPALHVCGGSLRGGRKDAPRLPTRLRASSDTATLGEQAAREATKTEGALARIEGDYIDGKIDAEAWRRLESRLRGDLDQLRALLRRLFVGFELASPTGRASGVLQGQGCLPSDDSEFLLDFGTYVLLPILRRDAIDRHRRDPAGVPAVQRVALSHDFLCIFFAAW